MRIVRAVVALAAAAALMTGCSVPGKGSLGIARDDRGQFVAIVQMCDGQVDSVLVYERESGDGRLTWDFDEPVDDYGVVTLDGIERIEDKVLYTSWASSSANSATALGILFERADLEVLAAGEILAEDEDSASFETTTMPVGDFREMVLRHCGDG
jgi:hypothetical protein